MGLGGELPVSEEAWLDLGILLCLRFGLSGEAPLSNEPRLALDALPLLFSFSREIAKSEGTSLDVDLMVWSVTDCPCSDFSSETSVSEESTLGVDLMLLDNSRLSASGDLRLGI